MDLNSPLIDSNNKLENYTPSWSNLTLRIDGLAQENISCTFLFTLAQNCDIYASGCVTQRTSVKM